MFSKPVLGAVAKGAAAYRHVFAASPLAPMLSRPKPVRRTGFDLDLVVAEVHREAADVVSIAFERPDGGDLPEWTPGAHLDVFLPSGVQRQYSLCGDHDDRTRYRIAVRRIPDGSGSVEAHESVRAGATLHVRGPRNAFRLLTAPAYLFVAGGIGITPILAMYRAAVATGVPARLIYTGRSRDTMPFLDELTGDVSILADDECGVPDVPALMSGLAPGTAVYLCGPPAMVDAAHDCLPPSVSLHTERFSAAPVVGGRPFTATLADSGVTVEVAADETLLSAVRRVKPGVAYSCQQGFCGSCKTRVLAGDVEHRDRLLLDDERADSMLICISRARTDHLVLDA